MTVEKAISQLIESENFKEDCRTDARLRVFLHRLRNGIAKREMILSVLQKYGYRIDLNAVHPGKE